MSPCYSGTKIFPASTLPCKKGTVKTGDRISQNKTSNSQGPPGSPGFYSRMFLVPKPGNKWRPVIDLSSLNTFIKCPKFIMETPEQIRLAIQANDWVTSLDLSDAYLHVPSCRKYLRFAYQGQVWEFRALPYGLSPAPWLFTLIALEVKALAQRNGILMHIYLNDWLLRSQSRRILTKQTLWIQKMCRYLGLQINMAKSELNPSQDFVFLGYRFQTLSHRVLPSHKRVQAIYEMAHRFIQRDPNTVRSWMSLLGLLSATEKLVPMGRLHLRNMQHCLKGQWNVKLHSLHSRVQLSQSALTDLRWWMMSKHVLASCPTHPLQPTRLLFTDAWKGGVLITTRKLFRAYGNNSGYTNT